MLRHRSLIASFAALAAVATIDVAGAAPVWGSGATLTGSRTFAAGEILGFINGTNDSASVAWTIAPDGSTYRYTYRINTSATQTISHLILDLSTNCTAAGACFGSLSYNGNSVADSFLTFGSFDNSVGNSNPGMPAAIQGVKFNRPDALPGTTTFTISFLSDRAPVWGDFYAKGGNGTSNGFAIFNDGIDEHLTSSNVNDYIAVPDTVSACATLGGCVGGAPDPSDVPVPAMAGLFALGVAGLIAARRRRD